MNLKDDLKKHFKLNKAGRQGLLNLKIETLEDLIYYFPRDYLDTEKKDNLLIENFIIEKINSKKTFKSKKLMTEAILISEQGQKIKAIWLNQFYIGKIYQAGQKIRINGKTNSGSKIIFNPQIIQTIENEAGNNQKIIPIYKETENISSNFLYQKIKKILSNENIISQITENLPEEILNQYNLPSKQKTIINIHFPQNSEQRLIAEKRLNFEEIFYLQYIKTKQKKEIKNHFSFKIDKNSNLEKEILKPFKIELTNSQKNVWQDIMTDFGKNYPASRLIEGEVGSGKTLIAILASSLIERNNLQIAYMAPTEILAKQIFENFKKFLPQCSIALLTSKESLKFPSKLNPNQETKLSKNKLREQIANGEIKIIIGTHSLIQNKIFFENLGLVIIDEQHRFGRMQREALIKKDINEKKRQEILRKKIIDKKNREKHYTGRIPHLLLMTATPIPRTLALTILGDLDISILENQIKGRKKPETKVMNYNLKNRGAIFSKIQEEIKSKKQIFIICPKIKDDETDNSLDVVSIEQALKIYQKALPDARIKTLNAKLKKEEQKEIFEEFKNKKIDILISTSIIEVGIDVKNASVIIIESAERFGLSQLHQFRGRIVRGNHQPFCFLLFKSQNEITKERLKFFENNFDCFKLAEMDLKLRGAGELLGKNQSGISDRAMRAMANIKLVNFAKKEAEKYLKNKNLLIEKESENIINKIYLE